MTKTHKTYLDVLRIIAIWFVIFNHTRDYGYTYFATAVNQVGYWPGLLISVVTKIAVPVFLDDFRRITTGQGRGYENPFS